MLERIKRPIALILAFAVMVFCWFPTYVDALVLEGAAFLTFDLFLNILIIAMLGSEMDGALRGAAADDNVQPKDWLSIQINKYTNGQGLSEPGLANMFKAGVKYWKDGTIVINDQVVDWITDFQAWIWGDTEDTNSPNISDFADNIAGETGWYLGDVPVAYRICNNPITISNRTYYISDWIYGYYDPSDDSERHRIPGNSTSGAVMLYVLYNDGIYGVRYSGSGTSSSITYNTQSGTYGIGFNAGTSSNTWTLILSWPAWNHPLQNILNGIPAVGTLPNLSDELHMRQDDDQKQGDPYIYQNALGNGSNAGVSIGLPDSVLVGTDGQSVPADATVDIADYVSAVADAAAGVYYPTMPVAIPGEGVVDVPVSIPADVSVPVDGVDDVGVDESAGEAAGDVAGEASGEESGTGDYTVALSDFFPFCIPFDLLAMLQKFQASAEAPKVDVPFNIQGNVTVFTVDLSPWDPVARVLRTMEKIAFAIGLAWATKNLIQGGS